MAQSQQTPRPTANPLRKKSRRKLIGGGILGFMLTTPLAVAGYYFLTLDKQLPAINRWLTQNTGMNLKFAKLRTGFNRYGEPYLLVSDLSISNVQTNNQWLRLKKLNLVLALSSLYKWQPIFSVIELEGSKFALEYDKHGNILVNHEPFPLDDKSESPSWDWQSWLLAQPSLKINNINLEVTDSKFNQLPLKVNDINLSASSQGHKHQFSLASNLASSRLKLLLNFSGDGLTAINKWEQGSAHLMSVGRQGYLVDVNAQISNGQLKQANAKFDSNQRTLDSLLLSEHFQDLKGQIKLWQANGDNYLLSGNNLTIKTKYGYIFNDASLNGKINLSQGGHIDLHHLNLDGVTSLIHVLDNNLKLKLSGVIDNVDLDWKGTYSDIHDLNLSSNFRQVALSSQEANIPSINHINGHLKASQQQGEIQLKLTNSQLIYPKLWHKPLTLDQFATTLNWQIESGNKIKLKWYDSLAKTSDFALSSHGSYNLAESEIDGELKLKHLNLAAVYKYLPKSVAPSVINSLKTSLTHGSLADTTLTIKGNPKQFPFSKATGNFAVNGNLRDINYQFLEGYPGVAHLNAKLAINHQNIKVKLNSGTVGQLNLSDGQIEVPDFMAKQVNLVLKTSIAGSSPELLAYLESSPWQEEVKQVKSIASISGEAKLNLKLNLPLAQPEKFKLNGQLQLADNQIDVAAMEPNLQFSQINGEINFDEHGLAKSSLNAHGLDSDFNLSIVNPYEINLSSTNLNYQALAKLAYPALTKLIQGQAATNLSYNLKTQELNLNSDLVGVSIAALAPLGKPESAEAPINLSWTLKPQINRAFVNYNNSVIANLDLTPNWQLEHLAVAINSSQTELDSPIESASKITLRANFDKFDSLAWADFLGQLATPESTPTATTTVADTSVPAAANAASLAAAAVESANLAASQLPSIYPIEVEIHSPEFWLSNYNLESGVANLLVTPANIHARLAMTNIAGDITYLPESQELNLDLSKLALNTANWQANLISSKYSVNQELQSLNPAFSISYAPTNNLPSCTNPERADNLAANNQQLLGLLIEDKPDANTLAMSDTDDDDETATRIATLATTAPAVNQDSESTTELNLPTTHFKIAKLYYQGRDLGQLSGTALVARQALILNNVVLANPAATTTLNLINNCFGCRRDDAYVAININSQINNFGNLLVLADQGDMFKDGNGVLDVDFIWEGNLNDYSQSGLVAYANLDISKGVLTHVNAGAFGALMGVINLSAINKLTDIENLDNINFNSFVGKGFAFDNLNSTLSLSNNDLAINNFTMQGDVANVQSFGNYYLDNRTIDTYLTVGPRLSGTIATTAGIVTLNPVIGFIVYLGQKLIGDPVSKALAISYHIKGDVDHPSMKRAKLSRQLVKNVTSSLDFIPNPAELLPKPSNSTTKE